jgi:O-antigen ligase
VTVFKAGLPSGSPAAAVGRRPPILSYLKTGALTLLTVALGIAMGSAMLTPSGTTLISVVVILIYLAVTLISPLNGLLLWLITQPLADSYVPLRLGAGIPDLTPTRFCLVFITVLVLARASIGRIKLAPFTKVDLIALLYLAGLTFSVPDSAVGWLALKDVFDLHLVPILVYVLARNLVHNRAELKKVVVGALAFATFVGLYAVYEQFTGHILFPIAADPVKVAYGDTGARILRGLLGHPHPFGRILGIMIPINFYLVLEEKRPTRRVLYFITLSTMLLGLFCTFRRTAWIAALASLFLVQWFYPRFRKIFLVLLVIASVALYVNRDQLSDSTAARRIQQGDLTTLHGRTSGWEYAITLLKRSPITGQGYGRFSDLAIREGQEDIAIESHYLNILVSAGLLGFVPYVALLIVIPLQFIKAFRSRDGPIDKWLIVMYWGAHLSYMINASTATVGTLITTSLLLLLAGALSGLPQARSRATYVPGVPS